MASIDPLLHLEAVGRAVILSLGCAARLNVSAAEVFAALATPAPRELARA